MASVTKVQILPLRKASLTSADEKCSESPRPDAFKTQKKTRIGKPKARSGCVTCKIRHVKCDETKPECNRCTSTGRQCDGYAIAPRKKREPRLKVPNHLSATPEISQDEAQALDYFYHKTAPALSSYFDADFWTSLVFQMSCKEVSVRHALTAVAALHQANELSSACLPDDKAVGESGPSQALEPLQPTINVSENRFAILQYNKAILQLAQRMNDASSSIDVTLLTCILFICVEFLRGNKEPAVKHFRAGMNLAMSSLAQPDTVAGLSSLKMRNAMLPIFNRLELFFWIYGSATSWDYPVELLQSIPEYFATIKEARDSLVHLLNLSLRFIKSVRRQRYLQTLTIREHTSQASLITQLSIWKSRLDSMLLTERVGQRDLDGAKVLRIHQIVALNWLKRCVKKDETATDLSMPDYEIVVSLAESVQHSHKVGEEREVRQSSSFLFEMEIVSPLYYVATKCRHPQIRRRAIALLKQSHRREGLWDSSKSAMIAERIMTIEEKNLEVLDGSQMPTEKDRVHRTTIANQVGNDPKHHYVDLFMLPDGFDGKWRRVREEIFLT